MRLGKCAKLLLGGVRRLLGLPEEEVRKKMKSGSVYDAAEAVNEYLRENLYPYRVVLRHRRSRRGYEYSPGLPEVYRPATYFGPLLFLMEVSLGEYPAAFYLWRPYAFKVGKWKDGFALYAVREEKLPYGAGAHVEDGDVLFDGKSAGVVMKKKLFVLGEGE